MFVVLFGVVMVAAPLVCWALLARERLVGWTVAAVLVVGASAVIALLVTHSLRPDPSLWLVIAYLVGSVAVVTTGRRIERRHSHPPDGRRRRIGRILFGCYTAMAALCIAPLTLFVALDDEPYVDQTEVLPLPPDLHLIDKTQVSCGSGTCGMDFVIGGDPGTPVEQVARQVRDHLTTSRGWQLTAQGTGCREEEPNADYQSSGITLTVRGDQVLVNLESGKGYGKPGCPES